MAITQPRAAGGLTGGRYGSFAGRGDGTHPVDVLTQPRAVAAYTGKRYGSFAGRGVPDTRLTQPRSHAAHTGRRYGSFAGRLEVVVEPPAPPSPIQAGGSYRYPIPADLLRLQRQRLIEDEELIAAVLIAAIPGLMRRH